MPSYLYSVSTDFNGMLLASDLQAEIKASSIAVAVSRVETRGDACEIVFPSDLSAAEKTTLDTVVAAHGLAEAKRAKFEVIDIKTQALIAQGFSFSGKQFSLSANAQSTYIGLYTVRLEIALTYPVNVNTLDNLGFQALANAVDVSNFYLTAVGTYRARLDSGTALKDQVRSAATIAAVEAVVDNR